MENNQGALGLATLAIGLVGIIAITMSDLSNWWLLAVPPISIFTVITAILITDWIVPDETKEEFDYDEPPKS